MPTVSAKLEAQPSSRVGKKNVRAVRSLLHNSMNWSGTIYVMSYSIPNHCAMHSVALTAVIGIQAQIQCQLERLTEAYLSTVVPLTEYQRRRQDFEQQLQILQQTERQLDADSQQQSQVANLVRSIEDFAARVPGSLEQASF